MVDGRWGDLVAGRTAQRRRDPGRRRRRSRTARDGRSGPLGVDVVEGGGDRADSVVRGLDQVRPEVDYIAVHDAVRPCLADLWIGQVFDAAVESGAAILAIPVTDTLKRVGRDETIEATLPRADLWAAQTPQVFRRELLVEAYAKRADTPVTDDAQLVEQAGHRVTIVRGSPLNVKVTTRQDLRLA